MKSIVLGGTGKEEFYEEVSNSVTHLFGAFLSVVAIYFLTITVVLNFKKLQYTWHHRVGSIVFGISLVVLYSLSTLYHSVGVLYNDRQEYKAQYRKFDHVAIFWLIAGTYTPLVLIILVKKGKYIKLGGVVLGSVWSFTFIGTILKLYFPIDIIPEYLSNSLFLLQGWMVIFIIKPLLRLTPQIIMKFIVAGGLFYSGGIFFLTWDNLIFNHTIWHFHVLLGSASHFISVVLTFLDLESLHLLEKQGVSLLLKEFLYKIK